MTEKENIKIDNIEEIEGYKLRMRLGLVLLIIGSLVIVLLPGIARDIKNATDLTDKYIKFAVISIGVVLYALGFFEICKMQRYHYGFKINNSYQLLLEESDYEKWYADLKKIEESL